MADTSLKFVVEAIDKASGPFGKISDSVSSFADSAAGKMAVVATALATAAAAAGTALFNIGSQFDDMSDSIRVGTGASGDALGSLEETALNIGKTIPTSFEEAGSAVADWNTRMGLSGDILETVASQTIEAGRLMGEAIDVKQVSGAFNAFQVSAGDAEGAMDTLFRVSQGTGVGMNELASTISGQAPVLQEMGFGLETSAALVGSLDKAGLDASTTLSAMRKGLVEMAKAGEDPEQTFQRVTGEIDKLIESGDTASAINLASGIFGTRGAAQFVGAVQSGALEMDNLQMVAEGSGDTILGLAGETNDFSETLQVLKNKGLAAIKPLADTVFSGISKALVALEPPLAAVTGWFERNPAALKAVAVVMGVLTVGIGAMAIAMSPLVAATWAFTAALLANPVTWIVVGIVALIAAIALLAANWDTVTAALGDAWDWVVEKFVAGWEWIKGIFGQVGSWFMANVWTPIKNMFTTLFEVLTWPWRTAFAALQQIWIVVGPWVNANIVQPVQRFFIAMGAAIRQVISSVKNFFTSAWSAISGWVSSNVVSPIKNAFSTITGFVRGVVDGVVGLFQRIGGSIGSALGSIASTITAPFRSAFNGIAGLWNRTVGSLSFTIPDWVPNIGGSGFSVPNIPMLAEGGIVDKATLAVIGEAGPEAVVPLDRAGAMGFGGATPQELLRIVLATVDAVTEQKIRAALAAR